MLTKHQTVSRSAYVANLRRAFLLRVHPDKFNSLSHASSQNSHLIKALSQRMAAQDFQDYTANISTPTSFSITRSTKKNGMIPYFMEKRGGSILKQEININDSVENILNSLVTALEKAGAVAPLPPDELTASPDTERFTWASHKNINTGIDHRFDVNTSKGRDVLRFLSSVKANDIEKRRAARLDAIALASIARQKYSFQAVDGIQLGWSSESFAVLLSSLIKLHDEHSSRFHVQSFYPLRLVFSPDEFRMPLDVCGGNFYLNPASTQLQWLEALQNVTPQSLEELENHRIILQQRTTLLQNSLGVKMIKGHSCTSQSYHLFLEQLSKSVETTKTSPQQGTNDSKSLQMEWLRLVVESPLACRRPRVTSEGHLRINTSLSFDEVRKAISKLSSSAQERLIQDKEDKERCKLATNQIQFALGLQRVFRIGVVSHTEFLTALSRLMKKSDIKRSLSGYSLGISSSGSFCRLGDDGSMIIPHDFS